MATITPVIVPAKALKDGRHKIRISVAHNGETRYILTSILIDSIREFKNGMVTKRPDAAYLNSKLRGILQEYSQRLDELGHIDSLTCAELVTQLKNSSNTRNRTLDSIFEEYCDTAKLKPNTLHSYRGKWNTIGRHLDRNILVSNLSRMNVLALEKALTKQKLSPCTIWAVMGFLRTIVNYAIKYGYASFKISPFLGYKYQAKKVREAWLTTEEMSRIKNLHSHKLRKGVLLCSEIFMLSYYLGGINMIDLLSINFKECGDTMKYIRKKIETRTPNLRPVEFQIPHEAKEIIDKYMNEDGYLRFTKFGHNNMFSAFFRDNLPKLAEAVGVERLIYYSARKSFAQHAFDLGISTAVIDYILGHTEARGSSSIHHYLRVTPEMATDAIRKVLDNLK